jgi:hypothetical protein
MATKAKKSVNVADKTLSKKAVKVSKKSVTKNANKEVLKDPVVIKGTNKNDFLEQLSQIKEVKNKKKIPSEAPLTFRNNLSLAKLSPFRFPLDTEKVATQTARIAGMAFVVIGACLSIFHLPLVQEELVQNSSALYDIEARSLLAQSGGGGGNNSYMDYCKDNRTANCTTNTTVLKISPKLTASLVSGDSYKVVVDTPYESEKVKITIFNSAGGVHDSMEAIKGRPWSYSLNTANYPEGTYKAIAYVRYYGKEYTTNTQQIVIDRPDPVVPVATINNANTGTSNSVDTTTQDDTDSNSNSNSDSDSTTDETTNTNNNDIATENTDRNVEEVNDEPPVPVFTLDEQDELDEEEFEVNISNSNDLKGEVSIAIKVADADDVYAKLIPVSSVMQFDLPDPVRRSKTSSEWIFKWNTNNNKNGKYYIYIVAVKDGVKRSVSKEVFINNRTAVVAVETAIEKDADETQPAVKVEEKIFKPQISPEIKETQRQIVEIEDEFKAFYDTSLKEAFDQVLAPPEEEMEKIEAELERIMGDYQIDIEAEIEKLKVALRSGDENQINQIEARITELQNKIVKNAFQIGDNDLITFISQGLESEFGELKERVKYTETVIKERVGEEVFKDKDNDGITDYDETVLYKTDPESADTDTDGFPDGAEVLGGFDPLDAAPEALVLYESPKDVGLVREDIFAVEAIETTKIERSEEDGSITQVPAAVIKGKGLPNSFVNLYVFSTPIVVTVKTDKDGNWAYTFDKELDDGEHEVYVGVTDNAGKIVAKSEPIRFVKTAEAFTQVANAQVEPQITFTKTNPGLMTQNMILLVMSISIVMIGLILIILGYHLRARKNGEHLVQDGFVPST